LSLEYCPLDPQAWFAPENGYSELSQPSVAEKCYRKSLAYAEEEKKSDMYYNLGNSLYDQAKLTNTIKCYEKVRRQFGVYEAAKKI